MVDDVAAATVAQARLAALELLKEPHGLVVVGNADMAACLSLMADQGEALIRLRDRRPGLVVQDWPRERVAEAFEALGISRVPS